MVIHFQCRDIFRNDSLLQDTSNSKIIVFNNFIFRFGRGSGLLGSSPPHKYAIDIDYVSNTTLVSIRFTEETTIDQCKSLRRIRFLEPGTCTEWSNNV